MGITDFTIRHIIEMYFIAYTILSLAVSPTLAINRSEELDLTWNKESLKYANCSEHEIQLDQQICLENGYRITEPPYPANTTIYISFYILNVKKVSDMNRILTFQFFAGETWMDPRIKASFSEFETFKDIRWSSVGDLIWKPSMRLRRMTEQKQFFDSLDQPIFSLSPKYELGPNVVSVERVIGGTISVYCDPWNLELYPLDIQICALTYYHLAPYNMSFVVSPLINYNETYNADGFRVTSYLILEKHKENFTIHIELKRKLLPFFVASYLPSMAIVCLSGSSFLLPTNPLPARIGLGVTNFLTLTNLLIHKTVILYYTYIHLKFRIIFINLEI